jgi:hypothetical protein
LANGDGASKGLQSNDGVVDFDAFARFDTEAARRGTVVCEKVGGNGGGGGGGTHEKYPGIANIPVL